MDWRLPWVLGLAFDRSTALPAWGGERRSPELRRRQRKIPLGRRAAVAALRAQHPPLS